MAIDIDEESAIVYFQMMSPEEKQETYKQYKSTLVEKLKQDTPFFNDYKAKGDLIQTLVDNNPNIEYLIYHGKPKKRPIDLIPTYLEKTAISTAIYWGGFKTNYIDEVRSNANYILSPLKSIFPKMPNISLGERGEKGGTIPKDVTELLNTPEGVNSTGNSLNILNQLAKSETFQTSVEKSWERKKALLSAMLEPSKSTQEVPSETQEPKQEKTPELANNATTPITSNAPYVLDFSDVEDGKTLAPQWQHNDYANYEDKNPRSKERTTKALPENDTFISTLAKSEIYQKDFVKIREYIESDEANSWPIATEKITEKIFDLYKENLRLELRKKIPFFREEEETKNNKPLERSMSKKKEAEKKALLERLISENIDIENIISTQYKYKGEEKSGAEIIDDVLKTLDNKGVIDDNHFAESTTIQNRFRKLKEDSGIDLTYNDDGKTLSNLERKSLSTRVGEEQKALYRTLKNAKSFKKAVKHYIKEISSLELEDPHLNKQLDEYVYTLDDLAKRQKNWTDVEKTSDNSKIEIKYYNDSLSLPKDPISVTNYTSDHAIEDDITHLEIEYNKKSTDTKITQTPSSPPKDHLLTQTTTPLATETLPSERKDTAQQKIDPAVGTKSKKSSITKWWNSFIDFFRNLESLFNFSKDEDTGNNSKTNSSHGIPPQVLKESDKVVKDLPELVPKVSYPRRANPQSPSKSPK